MRGRERVRVAAVVAAVLGLVALGWSLPGAKGEQEAKIGAGYSFFETLSGTRFDFSKQPIPAGFFEAGSETFRGVVRLRGIPLGRFRQTNVGTTDTVVRRLASVDVAKDTVPIELVALSLVSASSVRVTSAGGTVELWDLRVELSPRKRSTGSMMVVRGNTSGGTFESTLTVWPLFTFIRRADGEQRTLDLGQLEGVPASKGVTLRGKGRWTSQPRPGALDHPLARGFWPRSFAQRAAAAVQWTRQPRDLIAPEFKVYVPAVLEVTPGTSAHMQMTYESKWLYWLDLAVRPKSPGGGIEIIGVAPRALVGPRRVLAHDVTVQVAPGTPLADYPLSVNASFRGVKETAVGTVRVTAPSQPPPPPPPPPPGPPPPSGETRRLTVEVKGDLKVTSSPSGIDCPGDCTENYAKDTQVTLTASSGNVVWTGCLQVGPTMCIVTMDADRTVIVETAGR